MDPAIREAGTGDIAALTRLSQQLGYQVSETATRNSLAVISNNDHEAVFVATDGAEVIAWMHIFHTVRLESGSFCELGGLVVDERYRGKGIGRVLIGKAKQWCSERKVDILKLRSNVIRKDAHRFYRQLGFEEVKEQKVFEIKSY